MARLGYVPTPNPYRTGLKPKDLPPRPLWHWPMAVVLSLLSVYLLFVCLFWSIQPTVLFMTRAVMPKDEPLDGTSRIEVATPDGERLGGYWRKPAPGMPVVVTFHGFESPRFPARRFASGKWASEGWGVIAVAFRGYPGSSGTPTEEGLEADAEAVRAFVLREAPDAPIVYHGRGLGAALAVRMAENHEARGVYLESAYTSKRDYLHYQFPFIPALVFGQGFTNERRIPYVQCPVLIAHWQGDRLVPVDQVARLAEANRDAVFVTGEGSGEMLRESPHDDRARAMFRPRRRTADAAVSHGFDR